jgi:hypothetical protein
LLKDFEENPGRVHVLAHYYLSQIGGPLRPGSPEEIENHHQVNSALTLWARHEKLNAEADYFDAYWLKRLAHAGLNIYGKLRAGPRPSDAELERAKDRAALAAHRIEEMVRVKAEAPAPVAGAGAACPLPGSDTTAAGSGQGEPEKTWKRNGFPLRLAKLYESLAGTSKLYPKAACEIETDPEVGEQPARIMSDYRDSPKYKPWVKKHIGKTRRGEYFRKA